VYDAAVMSGLMSAQALGEPRGHCEFNFSHNLKPTWQVGSR
jgi:hypothetical protein